jgi:hypothetical protein
MYIQVWIKSVCPIVKEIYCPVINAGLTEKI